MNDNAYFNPFRKHHVILLAHLEKSLVNNKDKIDLIKFGERTQHIFVNDTYLMSINWELV